MNVSHQYYGRVDQLQVGLLHQYFLHATADRSHEAFLDDLLAEHALENASYVHVHPVIIRLFNSHKTTPAEYSISHPPESQIGDMK